MTTAESDAAETPKSEGEMLLRERRTRQKNDATALALIIVSIVSAILIFFYANDIATVVTEQSYDKERTLGRIQFNTAMWRLFSAVVLIGALGLITFLYASGSQVFQLKALRHISGGSSSIIDLDVLAKVLDTVTKAAEEIKNSRFVTQEDRNIISSQIEGIVRESLPSEYLEKIDQKYGGVIRNEKISIYIEDFMKNIKERLLRFQGDLGRKAASSLAWGLSTAVFGLIVLAAFIYSPPQGTWDNPVVIFHFAARLSLVAIIEVVAFFFLSQYRFTLLDEKYINNEISNAELRLLSIIVAAKLSSEAATENALGELSRTERNFALRKGEISVFHSGAGGDLLQSAVIADLLRRMVPSLTQTNK